MSMSEAEYTITLHDPKQDTDDEVAERVAFSNVMQAEILPDEAPQPVDQAIAALRASPERFKRWSFRARDGQGNLVAMGSCTIDPDERDNPDMLGININVLAEHRRKGLGTRLLDELVRVAQAEGKTRLIGSTNGLLPAGAEFASSIGAESKMAAHMNRLLVSRVDRALMEKWVADGPVRAEGYELIAWDGTVPEEYMEKYLDLLLVMNTAPRDDLQMNDFTITPQEYREQEKVQQAAGIESWFLVARHKEDDAWVGLHDVHWSPGDPKHVYVGNTGVRPEHRGHALGKWLKAKMTLRILDERPDITEIRTGNADSNDAMLGINKEMGYEHWVAQSTWEVSVEQAAKWLASRGMQPA
jgi:mycothiol synthase